jgi:hypothetical protein
MDNGLTGYGDTRPLACTEPLIFYFFFFFFKEIFGGWTHDRSRFYLFAA